MDTLTTADTLPVAETFGPTLQGEGPSTGRAAFFVRLGGCNLSCRWCDTPYTWDASRYDLREEIHREDVAGILGRAAASGADLLVVTGGEPLLHQRSPAFATLLGWAAATGRHVEVETNGTIPPAHTADRLTYNVSPKLRHSGDPEARRLVPFALRAFAALAAVDRAAFKFVCTSPADVEEALAVAARYSIPPAATWIMPEGVTADRVLTVARDLAPAVLAAGVNLSLRTHTLLWGEERGR